MPLRIAFDLDGVLADMESELARQAEMLFGDATAGRPPSRAAADQAEDNDAGREAGGSEPGDPAAESTPPLVRLSLSSGQRRKLWRHVEGIENFWETLQEIEPGAVAQLAEMAQARRWEVIFLTKRPQTAGRTAQAQTQRWLKARGFELPSVFVVQGSRGRIAASLDLSIVVDDRIENCLDVVFDSKARAILIWREDEQQLPVAARRLGIGAVRSMAQCFSILAEVDTAPATDAGVFERVLRMLGLREDSQTA